MKQRAATLLLVIGALALFYALFFPKPASPGSTAAPPLSTESGPEGLAGVWQWLRLEHIPVVSLRQRYDQLDRGAGTDVGGGTGNVLIASLPQRLPMNTAEAAALGRWVERGNTLVVLAALDDTPRWATGAGPQLLADLLRMTHFTFIFRQPTRAAMLRSLAGPTTLLIEPRGRHALLAGVQRVQDVSVLPASRWIGTPGAAALAIAEAQRSDGRDAVMWVAPRRAGQEIVCAFAAAFSNAQIDQADNARLLANIIAWSRAPTGRVIFDDAHQGLVDFYDPRAFFADPRLHATLWWILGVWLVWVLGSQVLRSRQVAWRPVDETALIDASGRFFSARVSATEAARALLRNFFDEIHRRLRQVQDGTPPWEWLAAQPGVMPPALAALRDCEARVAAGERVSLARVHNLLARLRRSIG